MSKKLIIFSLIVIIFTGMVLTTLPLQAKAKYPCTTLWKGCVYLFHDIPKCNFLFDLCLLVVY